MIDELSAWSAIQTLAHTADTQVAKFPELSRRSTLHCPTWWASSLHGKVGSDPLVDPKASALRSGLSYCRHRRNIRLPRRRSERHSCVGVRYLL
jgi:hypothetical protein